MDPHWLRIDAPHLEYRIVTSATRLSMRRKIITPATVHDVFRMAAYLNMHFPQPAIARFIRRVIADNVALIYVREYALVQFVRPLRTFQVGRPPARYVRHARNSLLSPNSGWRYGVYILIFLFADH